MTTKRVQFRTKNGPMYGFVVDLIVHELGLHIDFEVWRVDYMPTAGLAEEPGYTWCDALGIVLQHKPKSIPYIRGEVKWDGCVNFSFPHEEGDMHTCDRQSLVAIGEALEAVWMYAIANCPKADPNMILTDTRYAAWLQTQEGQNGGG